MITATRKIAFDAERCKGCALCVIHCARGCVKMSQALSANGYLLPIFNAERCTSCGICGWLCPDLAISIYK